MAQRKQVVEDQARLLDKQGCVHHVRSAAFSPVDIDAVLVLLGSPQYSAMVVPATSLVQAPGPPSPNVVFLIEEKVKALHVPVAVERPWFCELICPHREQFHGVALGSADEGGNVLEWWLLLFAKQQPHEITFLRLAPRPRIIADDDVDVIAEAIDRPPGWDHVEFDFMPPTFRYEHNIGFSDGDDVLCLHGITLHGLHAGTSHTAMEFERLVVTLSAAAEDKTPRDGAAILRRPRPVDEMEAYLAAHPWVSRDDFKRPPLKRARVQTPDVEQELDGPGSQHESDDEPQPLPAPMEEAADDGAGELHVQDDEDDPNVPVDLERDRNNWAWGEGDQFNNFYARMLGGRWTLRNTGELCDCVCGSARAHVREWCGLYKLALSFRCTFARYGREDAHMLVREWCRRGEWFYMAWFESEHRPFQFTDLMINDYPESLEFNRWMATLLPGSASFDRGANVRQSVPAIGAPGAR